MKILYFVPYVPNLIRVRPYNLIRELVKRGHEVTVATVWTNENEFIDVANLSQSVKETISVYLPRWHSYLNCLSALPTRVPLQAVYSWHPLLIKKINHVIRGDALQIFDIVHVEHLRGAKYGLRVRKINPKVPIIWDSVDCLSLLFKLAAERSKRLASKWITSFEHKRNQWYEGWLTSQFDQTLVTSIIDQKALDDLSRKNRKHSPKLSVLPNGVDLDYFTCGDNNLRLENTIVVSGKMSYHANIAMVLDLVDKIMPHIWAIKPDVQLWVVGKDPAPEIKSLSQKKGITITGTVNDIRPYLQRATLAATPISYGVGIQNKVLEAMACGTPVVSTPQAVSTLDVSHGKEVLIAENPDEFAQYVLQLLDDRAYREQIGEAGRKYVEANHNWSEIVKNLEEIYYETIKRKMDGGEL